MQFDELCALVGALRDRVAELEAKEAVRAERETAPPCEIVLNRSGWGGNAELHAAVERAVRAGMAVGGRVAPSILFAPGESGPEAIMPPAVWPKF